MIDLSTVAFAAALVVGGLIAAWMTNASYRVAAIAVLTGFIVMLAVELAGWRGELLLTAVLFAVTMVVAIAMKMPWLKALAVFVGAYIGSTLLNAIYAFVAHFQA